MDTSKFETSRVKIDWDDFNDASNGVKNGQEKIDFFTGNRSSYNSSSIESDFVDHRLAIDSYKEQIKEKLDGKNPNLEELGHSEFPENSSESEDIESATDEGKPSESFETVSRTLPLGFRDGGISANEVAKGKTSFTVPQRLSVPPMENDDATKRRYCSKPLEKFFSVGHQVNVFAQKKRRRKICSKSSKHTGEKPIFCRAFTHSYGFGVRTSEKPVLAELRSKSFSRMGILKIHERNCTGEKPFHCKIFTKAFAICGNLRVHGKIHAGKKSLHCKICSMYSSHSVSTSMASFMNFQSIHLTERF